WPADRATRSGPGAQSVSEFGSCEIAARHIPRRHVSGRLGYGRCDVQFVPLSSEVSILANCPSPARSPPNGLFLVNSNHLASKFRKLGDSEIFREANSWIDSLRNASCGYLINWRSKLPALLPASRDPRSRRSSEPILL